MSSLYEFDFCPGEEFSDLGGQLETEYRPATSHEAFTSSRPASSTAERAEPEGNDGEGEKSIEDTVAEILDDDDDEAVE